MSTACSVAQCSSPAHCNGSGGRGNVGVVRRDVSGGVEKPAGRSVSPWRVRGCWAGGDHSRGV
ncbi:hypothetical protein CIP107521_02221 [Corynebacterium diphtheriae]|nr:hypothetical protein CIP107521_02221 [Corynebacterium diphtheriae]